MSPGPFLFPLPPCPGTKRKPDVSHLESGSFLGPMSPHRRTKGHHWPPPPLSLSFPLLFLYNPVTRKKGFIISSDLLSRYCPGIKGTIMKAIPSPFFPPPFPPSLPSDNKLCYHSSHQRSPWPLPRLSQYCSNDHSPSETSNSPLPPPSSPQEVPAVHLHPLTPHLHKKTYDSSSALFFFPSPHLPCIEVP